jgi:membrane-associated phospholipid phosphatase
MKGDLGVREDSQQVLDKVQGFNISKKQWLWLTLGGIASLILSFYLWYQVDIDKSILFSLNYDNFNRTFILLNKSFSKYGMSFIVFIYLCHLIFFIKYPRQPISGQIYLLVIFSFAVAGISGDLMKEIFDRTRPIHQYATELKGLTNSKSPSFPSGHATKSISLVLPFLFFSYSRTKFDLLLKVVLSTAAFLVCFSRIFLGAHYFSDVLAGFGWAMLTLPVAVLLSNSIFRKMKQEDLEKAKRIWRFVYFALFILLILI